MDLPCRLKGGDVVRVEKSDILLVLPNVFVVCYTDFAWPDHQHGSMSDAIGESVTARCNRNARISVQDYTFMAFCSLLSSLMETSFRTGKS